MRLPPPMLDRTPQTTLKVSRETGQLPGNRRWLNNRTGHIWLAMNRRIVRDMANDDLEPLIVHVRRGPLHHLVPGETCLADDISEDMRERRQP